LKNYTCVLAGLMVSPLFAAAARAALVINLRFADGSTTHALTAADVGHDVEIDVWASITGNNPPSPTNFYGIQYVYYSAVSSLPGGTGTGVNGGIDASANALVAPFSSNFGTQVGVTQDINGDGVADVGSSTTLTDVAKPRSEVPTFDDNSIATKNALPDGYEFEVEKLFFHVNSLADGETDFTAMPPPLSVSGGFVPANWWQDAPTDNSPTTGFQGGAYSGGTTVRLVAVPEPGSVAMMLVAGGLMMRRRRGSLGR
jgi:hypothetical protein